MTSTTTKISLALSVLLGFLVFFLMGLRHTQIGFHSDDYGIIYNGRYSSLSDVKTIFKNGDPIISANRMIDRDGMERKSFLETLYRPLLLLVMGTEHKIFGPAAYPFHLVHTALHTLTALTIFATLTFFTGPFIAAPLAFFWGLHTSLKDYFFWQCYIQNSLEAVLLCIVFALFISGFQKRKKISLACSLILFFILLLLRETLLILPVLIFLWVALMGRKNSLRIKMLHALEMSLLYCLPIIGYLGLRLWAHPFSSSISCLGVKHFNAAATPFWTGMRGKFFDILTWLIDLIGIKWLPQGNTFLKIVILLALSIFMVCGWHKNRHKNFIVFTAAGIFLSSWPSLLLVHCSRYLYLPTFFFTLFIGLLASSFSRSKSYLFIGIALTYAVIQGYVTTQSLNHWVQETHYENTVIKKLAATSTTQPSITLVSFPTRLLGAGTIPGMHLYGAAPDAHLLLLFPYIHRWEDGATTYPIIKKVSDSLEISAPTATTVWFHPGAWPLEPELGSSEIIHYTNSKISSFIFRPSLTAKKNMFILIHEKDSVSLERISFDAH